MRTQKQKAEDLLALHTSGRMLVLPNVWNPIGARILEAKGYPAVATASAALSASLGYQDGERIQRATLIDFIGRISRCVDLPVTADIESGYGDSLDKLQETINLVLDCGVVGINLEDSLQEGGALRKVEDQCARIAAVRETATACGIHLVINARVDTFLSSAYPAREQAIEEAARRASAYIDAGADCIYPIGPGDEDAVRILRERISHPINILASPSAAPLSLLQKIGVNRVSFGPFVFRACMKTFVDIVDGLAAQSDYQSLSDALSSTEIRKFLRGERE